MAPPQNPQFRFRNKRWNTIFRDFLKQVPNATTRDHYYRTLRRFFVFIEKKYKEQRTPDKVSSTDIEEFLQLPVREDARRSGQKISPYSRNTYLTVFKAFYGYCTKPIFEFRGRRGIALFKKGMCPSDHVSLAHCGDADRDMTEEEVRKFFFVIDRTTLRGKRDFSLFWALFITGRRRKEIVMLRRRDLLPFVFEDGHQGWRYRFRAKWKVEDEFAEMHQSVVDTIIEFHKAAGRDFYRLPPEAPLFPGTIDSKHPMNPNWATTLFRNYAKEAGLPPNVVTHSLRHESAWQRYLANGHDLLAVKDDLGHSNVATTMRYIERRKKKLRGDPISAALVAKFGS